MINIRIKTTIAVFSLLAGIVSAKEAYKGFPSVESAKNLKENFKNPPKGYGNVPFYWWNGDSLVKERLADQLSILGDAAVDGFAVKRKTEGRQLGRGWGVEIFLWRNKVFITKVSRLPIVDSRAPA